MDDLVRWLGEQLDEDERTARAAGSLSGAATPLGERWRVSGSHADDGGTYWSITTVSPDLDRISVVEMVGSGMSGGGAHTEGVAVHIAAHDPARVLREIDAKRQVLALHSEGASELFCAHCEHEPPCPTLRLLALPYADRPGYREDWRP